MYRFSWIVFTGTDHTDAVFLTPMSLFVTSLNSGSNGNCYYIGNNTEAVLIDAGISCRETEKRMKSLGLDITKVKAVFVSHEHTDHITGISTLSKKYQLPVYITTATHRNCKIYVQEHLIKELRALEPVTVGALMIKAFTKSHDAADPHSFLVQQDHLTIGVFTDIGHCCKQVKKYFSECHAVFLEANYCEEMLAKGDYPYHLKRRISSDKGHLSNSQALDLFKKYRSPHLSHLFLSHLSKNNNTPELVNTMFSAEAAGTEIVVASRYSATAVYCIEGNTPVARRRTGKNTILVNQQLSLFQ